MAYAITTFTQLKDRLNQRVGGEGTFWCEAEREIAINEALNVWQLLVGEFSGTGVLLSSGISQEIKDLYDAAAGTVNIVQEAATTTATDIPLQITRLGTIVHTTTGSLYSYPKLVQVSIPELDHGYSGWRTGSATTPDYWAPCGVNKVIFYPRPNANIKVDYNKGSRLLNANADYVQLGDEEINRILDYAVWQLNVKSGTEEAFGTTNPLKGLFLLAAETRNAKLKNLQLYKDFLGGDYAGQEPFLGFAKTTAKGPEGQQ